MSDGRAPGNEMKDESDPGMNTPGVSNPGPSGLNSRVLQLEQVHRALIFL